MSAFTLSCLGNTNTSVLSLWLLLSFYHLAHNVGLRFTMQACQQGWGKEPAARPDDLMPVPTAPHSPHFDQLSSSVIVFSVANHCPATSFFFNGQQLKKTQTSGLHVHIHTHRNT